MSEQVTHNCLIFKVHFYSMKARILIAAALFLVTIATCCTSCNVTRKITTESSYFQKGDTTTTIVTKTTESYDARKQ